MHTQSCAKTVTRRGFLGACVALSMSAGGLLLLDGCGAIASPSAVRRVGFVSSDPPDAPWHAGLWDGLRERGWVEGKNLAVERRLGAIEGDPNRVTELTEMGLDVLVTVGTPATSVARQATTTLPIVFLNVRDPVGVGLVTSLARPGGNVTGVSQGASTSLSGKHLEVLLAVVPGLSRVANVVDAGNPAVNALGLAETEQAARGLGVQVRTLEVRAAEDFATAFASAAAWPANGVIVAQSGLFFTERARIADVAAGARLPAMYRSAEFVDAGGLMSYGSSQRDVYGRAASHVDKILRGARPADVPVEQLTTVDFAVNTRTAQMLGLTIPPDVAAQVTKWVQ